MTQALLAFHFLALAAGIGVTIANGVIAATATGLPAPEVAALRRLGPRFGQIGRAAVALLWLSGLALLAMIHGFSLAGLGSWFWAKMAAVLVLTGAVVGIYLAELRVRGGDGSAAAAIAKYARVTLPAATVAVICAVMAFSGR